MRVFRAQMNVGVRVRRLRCTYASSLPAVHFTTLPVSPAAAAAETVHLAYVLRTRNKVVFDNICVYVCIILRPSLLNLGFCILPSKVASDPPLLGRQGDQFG